MYVCMYVLCIQCSVCMYAYKLEEAPDLITDGCEYPFPREELKENELYLESEYDISIRNNF